MNVPLVIAVSAFPLFLTSVSQVLRPWCWYCEREFEDEKGGTIVYHLWCRGLTEIMISVDATSEGKAL